MSEPQADGVGSVSEEATRLFAAAESWLRDAAGGAFTAADAHIATGADECQLCPLCRLIALMRGTRPEVFEHLVDATGSLLAAMRAAVEAHDRSWASRRPSRVIGIDIGGTKVAGGVVDEDGRILARTRRRTPSSDPDQIVDVIAEVVTELRRQHHVDAVGIGAAGFVDADRSVVLFAPNLAWRNEPLRDHVAQRVGLPVDVENDANCAAWAEARFGAARGSGDVVAVTVGTGIGGGVLVHGRIHRGAFGCGAEMGHIEAVRDGIECGCGQRGCWEQYASGRALGRIARELASTDPARARAVLALGDGSVDAIEGEHVTRAAAEGDPLALEVVAEVARWLGYGLADLACVLDPAVVVIGGGVSSAGALLLDPTREAYRQRLPGAAYRPVAEIRLAELGNDAGLVGAADLARTQD